MQKARIFTAKIKLKLVKSKSLCFPFWKLQAMSLFLIKVLILFFLSSPQLLCSAECPLCPFLPADGEAGEWRRDGQFRSYSGDELYLYIDGGAEIYHEFGFRRVIVQDYINKKGKSISLEIFEMSDSESAFGIYTFKTGKKGSEVKIGDKALLEDYYLNFWKHKFLVTLTGFERDQETGEGLLNLARVVERKLNTKGSEPFLTSLLPGKGLIETSIKYFKGWLGLFNCYPFFPKDIFPFEEGIKGDYESGETIFILKYRDLEEAKERFLDLKKGFSESSRHRDFRLGNDERFELKDSRGNIILSTSHREFILIFFTSDSKEKERREEALSEVLEHIQRVIN